MLQRSPVHRCTSASPRGKARNPAAEVSRGLQRAEPMRNIVEPAQATRGPPSHQPAPQHHGPGAHKPALGSPRRGQRPHHHATATPHQSATSAPKTPWRGVLPGALRENWRGGRGVMTSHGNPRLPVPSDRLQGFFSPGAGFVLVLVVASYKYFATFYQIFAKHFYIEPLVLCLRKSQNSQRLTGMRFVLFCFVLRYWGRKLGKHAATHIPSPPLVINNKTET
jgi:hypothetical protein